MSKALLSSADYEDSVKELDALLHELTLDPNFPQVKSFWIPYELELINFVYSLYLHLVQFSVCVLSRILLICHV